MKTIKEARELLAQQDAIIEDAENEKKRLKLAIIEKFCTVKFGDIVECNGHSHTGKRMKIDTVAVRFGWQHRGGSFVGTGRILKKDGSPGQLCGTYSTPLIP
ncbi:MAG TPA: hypothetical protein VF681_13325 [Abditibacteriaceae bacterium]|jgi:hypothetical protein